MINLPLKIRDKCRSMKGVCRKPYFFIAVILLAWMAFPLELRAQQSVEAGIMGGLAYYNGDVNPARPFVNPQATFGLLARYNIDNRWTVKGSASFGTVTGSGTVALQDNTGMTQVHFTTHVEELALTGEFNFWKYETGSSFARISPYIMGGVALFHYSGTGVGNQDAIGTTKSFGGISPALIFGFGMKYSLTKKIGLALEWGMRKTLTDNLDQVSYSYATNLNNNDWYNFTVASITYKIDLTHGMSCKNLKW